MHISYRFYIDTPSGIATKSYGRYNSAETLKNERDNWMCLSHVAGVKITQVEAENLGNPVDIQSEVILDVVGSFSYYTEEPIENVVTIPKIKSTWIWEQGKPHAEEYIVVMGIRSNEINDYLVTTARIDGKPLKGGNYTCSNSLDRFWEAVTPYNPEKE